MFTLWNPTDQAQDFLVTFFFGEEEGRYKLPVSLGPKASTTIDVSKVIAAQQPDPDGHVISTSVREGSTAFSSAKGMTEPMTLVISGGVFNVQAATCGSSCINCCGYTGFGVLPNPLFCPYGGSGFARSEATYCTGAVVSFTVQCSWSSSNTGVATVDNGTNKGKVTGVWPGSAVITAVFPSVTTYTGTVCSGASPSCPRATPAPSCNGHVTPTVSISGPDNVPLRASGSTGPNSITLTATGNPSGGTYSWSTTSTKVTLGNTTSATVTVTSSAESGSVGDVPVKVSYTVNSQSGTATKNITVQKPTKLAIVAGTSSTTTEAACTTPDGLAGCGVTRTFKYEVLDQIGTGSPIQFAGMPVWDYICTGSPNQLNLQGYQTTCGGMTGSCSGSGPCGVATAADGTFNETLSVCAPACKSGSTCITAGSTPATQTGNVNGFSLTSDVKNLSYQCDRIVVNGN